MAALLFFGYFLCSSVYMFCYRPFHFNHLRTKYADSKDWKKLFGKGSFASSWAEDRKILWWVSFFGFVACLGFLIAAFSLW